MTKSSVLSMWKIDRQAPFDELELLGYDKFKGNTVTIGHQAFDGGTDHYVLEWQLLFHLWKIRL